MAPKKAPAAVAGNDSSFIASRPFDFVFVVGYFVFAGTQLLVFLMRCNHLLGDKYNQYCAHPLIGTSQDSVTILTDVVDEWGKQIFDVKTTSAITMANRVNVLCLAPMAILLAFGFVGGAGYVKNLAMLHSAVMLNSMFVVFTAGSDALASKSTFAGLHGMDAWTLFAAVIGFFLFFPLAVILRVWSDRPFKQSNVRHGWGPSHLMASLIKLLIIVWFFATILACYEFAVKHTKSGKGMPSVVDTTTETWQTVSPQVQEYAEIYAKQAQEYGNLAATRGAELWEEAGEQMRKVMAGEEKK